MTAAAREPQPGGLIVELDGRARRLADPRARPLPALTAVTPVPLGPPLLVGLAQLDGEVLPVLGPGLDRYTPILLSSSIGRVILLCGRVLPEDTPDATAFDVDALVEALRQAVRA